MADPRRPSSPPSVPARDPASMFVEDARRWLIQWFSGRELVADDISTDLEADYFDRGWLDSLGVLDLIEAAESRFDVRFSSMHFEDSRFRSIAGLASIIGELRSGR